MTFELIGIGGPGVTLACTPSANGGLSPLTCGTGGHTHGESDRPLVFPGTEVRYNPGDSDPHPLLVSGPSPRVIEGFSWTVPQAAGYYWFESTLTAPPGERFAEWFNGGFNLTRVLVAEGRLDVAEPGLAQLADSPQLYAKVRTADLAHVDEVAYSAKRLTRIALTYIAQDFLKNNGTLISYNDISLPKGGVFDLNISSGGSWLGPHNTHRDGLDVDVNKPGGIHCQFDTTVISSVSRVLTPVGNRSALYCEPNGNYHIDITSVKTPFGTQTLLVQ